MGASMDVETARRVTTLLLWLTQGGDVDVAREAGVALAADAAAALADTPDPVPPTDDVADLWPSLDPDGELVDGAIGDIVEEITEAVDVALTVSDPTIYLVSALVDWLHERGRDDTADALADLLT